MILDFDATPISIHSEKEHAAGHYKGGFGFNPLMVTCAREVLAGVLRPGNAGANNARDHLRVLELALEQLPESALDGEILARSDSAGASHDFAGACRETRHPLLARLPDQPDRPRADPGPGRGCVGAGSQPGRPAARGRVGHRADRPARPVLVAFGDPADLPPRAPTPRSAALLHRPGGHRFQCFITDQPDQDIAALEALHRQHAEVEDRVKTLKATGAARLPFHAFTANAAWFELALLAHDIVVWTQLLTLDGEHDLRTQAAALPHPSRRRPDHPPRPTQHPAPTRRLALGRSDPPGFQAPGRAPRSRLSTQPAPIATRAAPGRTPRPPLPRNTDPSDHNKRMTRAAHAADCQPPVTLSDPTQKLPAAHLDDESRLKRRGRGIRRMVRPPSRSNSAAPRRAASRSQMRFPRRISEQ